MRMIYLATIMLALLAPAAHAGGAPDREALSRPLPGLTPPEMARFNEGRALFRQSWVVAPASDARVGLGPLYNRLACISCHAKNGRGGAPDDPGQRMQSMLVRLSLPGRDAHGGPRPHPVYGDQLNEEGVPGVPGEGRAGLRWRYSTLVLADGERVALRRPTLEFSELAYGPLGRVLVSLRVAPHVAGLGLLESVSEAELARLARLPKPDGVRGALNRAWDRASGKSAVARFGLKANTSTLRQQIAGAFAGDMGITSGLFPDENCTPAQGACLSAAVGAHPELSVGELDDVEFYLAHLAPPPRRDASAPLVRRGEALFAQAGCAVCHRPSLAGGGHPRFPRLGPQAVAAYSDLLLHDMGPGLADGRPDFLAGGRQWRTAPLWGLGTLAVLDQRSGLLHDGRARTPQEAILWHGGEAAVARARYARLDRAGRAALDAFLDSL